MLKVNDTKIKYIFVTGKIYKVTHIDFCNLTIEANKTDLNISDVLEDEMFSIEEFEEFKLRLCNGGGSGVVIDIGEWIEVHRKGGYKMKR